MTMNVHTGEILGARLVPHLRPGRIDPPADPEAGRCALPEPNWRRSPTGRSRGSTRPAPPSSSITAMAALNTGVSTPGTVIDDGALITIGGQTSKTPERRRIRRRQPGRSPEGLLRRLLLHAGLKMWDTGALQHWAHLLGIGRPTGSICPVRPKGCSRPQPGATDSSRRGNRTALVSGRQRPACHRPGRPADEPLQMAIAYATVGQRRDRRHPPPRP